jgi:hypothetical protein
MSAFKLKLDILVVNTEFEFRESRREMAPTRSQYLDSESRTSSSLAVRFRIVDDVVVAGYYTNIVTLPTLCMALQVPFSPLP